MSKPAEWVEVCRSEQSTTFKVASFCADSRLVGQSPIDDLIGYLGSVLRLGTKELLADNDVLGRVLLLGLVSGAEMYFRSVLAKLISVCPLCRSCASSHMLSLAAVDYYGRDDLGFGLLENVSFATQGEVLKQTKKLTGIEWDQKSSVAEAISAFESLSHFRHAAVHARGELSPRNTQELGISGAARKCLIIRFPELQEGANVCLNAARAYNRFMYQKVFERWIGHRLFSGEWNADRGRFRKVLALFRAHEDSLGGPAYAFHLYTKLRPAIQSALKPKPV